MAGTYSVVVHRRFQIRSIRKQRKMVASVKTTEPTHTFSIRVPESLYQELRRTSEKLQVPQNRLILEGLRSRLNGDTDVATEHSHRNGEADRE